MLCVSQLNDLSYIVKWTVCFVFFGAVSGAWLGSQAIFMLSVLAFTG